MVNFPFILFVWHFFIADSSGSPADQGHVQRQTASDPARSCQLPRRPLDLKLGGTAAWDTKSKSVRIAKGDKYAQNREKLCAL